MKLLLKLAGPFFTGAGILHFVKPETYEQIMPPWIPAHRAMVYASGVAEVATGAALMHPDRKVRQAGGILGVLTMVGVFPVHIHMAANPKKFRKIPGGKVAIYGRMPFQLVFIAWLLLAGNRED